jgi:predicted transcriptional regulator
MPNDTKPEAVKLPAMLRFRCSSELKRAVRYLAADEEASEQAVLLRLLTEAVEREQQKRAQVAKARRAS